MLHVIFTPPFDDLLKNASYLTTQFEVGQSTKEINPELVRSVLVTGLELKFILNNFTGLPFAKLRDQLTENTDMSWFGDDAKFIVEGAQPCRGK